MSPQLCFRCERVRLDPSMAEANFAGYEWPASWSLDTLGDVRRSDCPLCELVASLCRTEKFSSDNEPPSDSEHVKLIYDRQHDHFTVSCAAIGSYICPTTEGDGISRAKDRLPEWIDFKEVCRWIRSCEEKEKIRSYSGHANCSINLFNPAVLPRNRRNQLDLRVVDVDSMCIVYAARHCKYIALSYVWGSSGKKRLVLTQDREQELMQPSALALPHIAELIPNTIIDAMAVVSLLGERYLWIDSLCLVQDDEDELEESIAIMDLFYEMATLTIIAAGDDAWTGLPGVKPTRRKQERVVREVIPGLRLTTVIDLDTVLRKSVYSTRAWTMQEELLSTRSLVFIHNQVYFQCRDGVYDEAIHLPGRIHHKSAQYSLVSMIFADDESDWRSYSSLIMYYMRRNLTHRNDVLRAVQGMLHKYSLLTGLRCFEGLSPPFHRSLLFEASPGPENVGFGRCKGFPSYTWAGWLSVPTHDARIERTDVGEDHRHLERHGVGGNAILRGWIVWHCKYADNVIFRFDKAGRMRKARWPTVGDAQAVCNASFRRIPISTSDINSDVVRPNRYPLLIFWTVCVNLTMINIKYVGREHNTYVPDQCTYEVADKLAAYCGRVRMDTVIDGLEEGQFALIASKGRSFWALMIRWKDYVAERCGIVSLPLDILDNCMPPGPRWKLVVLG